MFATASSVFVALGIRKSVEHKTKTMVGAKLLMYNSISAMIASGVAGFLNTWFMRQVEMKQGINVVDPETGEIVGKSKAAGKSAVV